MDTSSIHEKTKAKWPIGATICLALITLAVWALWPEILKATRNLDESKDLAELGDSYGSINALFSAIAMIGAIIAIFMQWNELRLQRDDLRIQQEMLRAQLDEAKEQRTAVEDQAKAMNKLAEETATQNYHSKKQNDLAQEDLAFRRTVQEQNVREAHLKSLPSLELTIHSTDTLTILSRGPTIHSISFTNIGRDGSKSEHPLKIHVLSENQTVTLTHKRPSGFQEGELRVNFQSGRGEWLKAHFVVSFYASSPVPISKFTTIPLHEIAILEANNDEPS